MGTGILGTFLSCIKGVKYPFMFQEGTGVSLVTLLWKRTSSCVEERIPWFFSSCGGMLGVPLELRRRPQGPACVASEKSGLYSSCEGHVGIPLESLPANRAVSKIQSGNSVFLSHGVRNLGFPIKLQPGSQDSSGVEAWNSEFLSSCQKGVRPLVEFRRGICAFSREYVGPTGLPSCCEGILGVPLEPVQGNQDFSGAEGELGVLFPCSWIRGVPLEIQLMTQASSCDARGSWDSS